MMMMQEYSSSRSNDSEESKGVMKHASLLHSVRKSSITKACKKAPVAPMPPNPIKVYKVDPINFRDLVQHLTGAPEFKPHAPPPSLLLQQNFSPITTLNSSFVDHPQTTDITSSNFSDWQSKSSISNLYHLQDLQSQPMGMGLMKSQEINPPASLQLNLSSPNSYNWCSSFPETMTTLEPGRVL